MMEHFGSCIDSFHLASIIKGQDLGMDGLSITKSTEEMERWSRGRIRKSGKRKRSGLNGSVFCDVEFKVMQRERGGGNKRKEKKGMREGLHAASALLT